ncbi:hypothetical protein [Limnohabitans planktonicus]|nr:hypothetical protein [Limnohabitans planktonicus]
MRLVVGIFERPGDTQKEMSGAEFDLANGHAPNSNWAVCTG